MSAARNWSISSRLIWRFTLTASGLLLMGLVLVYWTVVKHADDDDAEYMRDRMLVIRADIGEEFPNPASLQAEVRSFHDASQPPKHQIRVLDANARTLAESEGMSRALGPGLFGEPTRSVEAKPRAIEYRTADDHWYLLMSAWTGPADAAGNRWFVQLTMDRMDEKLFRQQFRAVLFGVLVFGVGGAALISRLVVRSGLAPVKKMEATMARVRATQLTERVSGHGWPSELQGMATAFDDMLGRLGESFARLSRFSADLAHDLRTPLFNMRGEAEVALSKTRSVAEYREVLESSLEELSRLTRMIDSLLFLARAENPERRIERTVFDGRRETDEIVDLHEAAADERKVQITVKEHASIYADAMLFRRVLSNLLSNALQHTPEGGRISLRLSQHEDGAAEVTVSDTGSGIDSVHLPRIFDRLYRADKSRGSLGSGLGLAIVKSIMQLHEGDVTVTSDRGRGTTVQLHFPGNRTDNGKLMEM